MKVFFVNRFFFPDECATSQILSDLAFFLASKGMEVHVVTSRQLYENASARLAPLEVINGVVVHRVWTSRFGRLSLMGRALDYMSFYLTAFICLFRFVDRETVVVAKTDPPLISVPTAFAVKLKGGRLINWLQDVFPEVGVQAGIKILEGKLGGLLMKLRDRSLRVAASNVVIGSRMRKLLLNRKIDEKKISVVQNWACERGILPVSRDANNLRAEWGLQEKFVVMYSGNLGRVHEYTTILNAAKLLRDEPDVVFLFVGGGGLRSEFGLAVQNEGLTNVIFKPYQPREALAQSLSVGDIHLISLREEFEGLVVPSKFYGILAVGRPALFVGAEDGELVQLIRDGQCGSSVKQGDSKGLAKVIVSYFSNCESAEIAGLNGRRFFEKKLTRECAMNSWYDLLKSVE